ncbi:MAG TPA: serine/threonine-protein kinase [Thermoanaerobaculia bacterium]|nr:serine/threonine-protein kinase [Thermoanaerobaculia bacterium]
METTRWHEVDRLFAETLDRPPAERPAFLDAACAGDAALRRELEQLLAADEIGSHFLAGSPEELLRLTLDDQEEEGDLGPYRLLRKIGSGGMGTVYLARREDEHYERDVAVKVLRSGLASTEALHRFIAERQILARLEHPNIARLYDGGSTEDGRPYLVMELVEGVPVDEYCDRHRLTIDQRLALFQKICSAVQHAHQNLLVHRDLKPANILVTPQGEPKLLDFGIAKRLAPEAEDTVHRTRIGLRLLTPRYASPEQVRGDAITTASDVYSLGVILYELLAGRSPYQLTAELPYERERVICEQEPERPSLALFQGSPDAEEVALDRRMRPQALAGRLRGDLDNIVLMALRKEPRRRYGSAAELAQDLEKHLQDLPVTARPDTLSYRTRKFARRHRTAVAATATVVLLTAISVASLIAQGRQLAQERDKARYALSFLAETFKQADPYQARGTNVTAREILDQGSARISRELAGEPDVQAAVMDVIGEANLGLGRFEEAEPLLTRALALRRQIFGSDSLEVAQSLEHLAAFQIKRSPLEKAESSLREALAIRRRRQGNGDLAVARTLNQLGEILVWQGAVPADASEIEAIFQEALAIARRVEGPEGRLVAETLIHLANFRLEQGNYVESERLYREGLAVDRKVLGDRDPRLYRDQSDFGVVLVLGGKYKEAEALLRRCLKTQREILGPAHPDVAETMHNLAMALHYPGRCREAEVINREVLAMVRSYYGPKHWRVANALHNLGTNLAGQERFPEAIALYEQSLEIRRQSGEEDTLFGRTLLVLAELYRNQKKYAQALDLAHQAVENFKKTRGPDHADVAWPLAEIGRSYIAQSRFKDAEPYLRNSLDIRLRRLAPDHIEVSKVQYLLAKCLIRQGRPKEARPLLQKARPTAVTFYGPDHEAVRRIDKLLAEAAAGATR